jgi:hypothetical protein
MWRWRGWVRVGAGRIRRAIWSREPEAVGPVGFKVTVVTGSSARARVAPGKRKTAQRGRRKKKGRALARCFSLENCLIVIPFGSFWVPKGRGPFLLPITLSKKNLSGFLAARRRQKA